MVRRLRTHKTLAFQKHLFNLLRTPNHLHNFLQIRPFSTATHDNCNFLDSGSKMLKSGPHFWDHIISTVIRNPVLLASALAYRGQHHWASQWNWSYSCQCFPHCFGKWSVFWANLCNCLLMDFPVLHSSFILLCILPGSIWSFLPTSFVATYFISTSHSVGNIVFFNFLRVILKYVSTFSQGTSTYRLSLIQFHGLNTPWSSTLRIQFCALSQLLLVHVGLVLLLPWEIAPFFFTRLVTSLTGLYCDLILFSFYFFFIWSCDQ